MLKEVAVMRRQAEEAVLAVGSRWWHHHPKYPGEGLSIEPTPYLTLPFRQNDLAHWQTRAGQVGLGYRVKYKVSEGWYYSNFVKDVIPTGHAAVDYGLPYGFPVAAPCDGYVTSSYYSYPLVDRNGNVKVKNSIHQRFGIGYFVQIYNPEHNRFVQLGHLSNISQDIPFSPPVREGVRWQATGHLLTPTELMSGKFPHVTWVSRGEIVGNVGYSGLTDQEDYLAGYDRPMIIDPKSNPTWSVPHIHMDEWMRNYITSTKSWKRDPYDIYKTGMYYPTPDNKEHMGPEPLFYTDTTGRPYFADV